MLAGLLSTDLFLGPSSKTAIILDCETVAAISAAEAADPGAEAAEGILGRLRLLYTLCEWTLSEGRETDSTGVLSTSGQVRWRKHATDSGRTGPVRAVN